MPLWRSRLPGIPSGDHGSIRESHTAAAFDIGPHFGAFTPYEPEWLLDPFGSPLVIIYPKMQMDSQQCMHILSTEYVASADRPQRQFYTPGVYEPLSYSITFPMQPDSAFRMISWTMTIAGEVATSEVSDRVAFGWTHPLAEDFQRSRPRRLTMISGF